MNARKQKCPCCGSNKIEIIYDGLGDKTYFVGGKFSMIQCKDCKFEFINPLLSEKELVKYYPKTEYYSFQNKNTLALKYHKLSAKYYSKQNRLLNFLLYPVKPLLYTYYLDKGKNLLEIGCGDGLKLGIYQKYGIETYGLEPYGSKLTKEEKKLGISRKTISKANYKKGRFDYIILKEVLEHVPNQKDVLNKCYFWLKDGGKLMITVQNAKGLWKKIFKENWFGYDVPRHLYNYNTKNIGGFLEKYGFKVNKIRAYDNPYMFVGSLQYFLDSKKPDKDHRWVFSNAMKLITTPLSLGVSYLGMGSLMEIECEKK